MKKILLILLLIISVGCNKENVEIENPNNEVIEENENIIEEPNNETQDDETKEPINIYLFWGDGCEPALI